jgi:putative transposase
MCSWCNPKGKIRPYVSRIAGERKLAVILKPATLFKFHQALIKQKYRLLFSSRHRGQPGPKGPSKELVVVIVEMKRRNPRFGCPRIAQEIADAFAVEINKDVVRRVLAKHYRPESGNDGPSWLTVIGHLKDSLWSVDLFRCESILLKRLSFPRTRRAPTAGADGNSGSRG